MTRIVDTFQLDYESFLELSCVPIFMALQKNVGRLKMTWHFLSRFQFLIAMSEPGMKHSMITSGRVHEVIRKSSHILVPWVLRRSSFLLSMDLIIPDWNPRQCERERERQSEVQCERCSLQCSLPRVVHGGHWTPGNCFPGRKFVKLFVPSSCTVLLGRKIF